MRQRYRGLRGFGGFASVLRMISRWLARNMRDVNDENTRPCADVSGFRKAGQTVAGVFR